MLLYCLKCTKNTESKKPKVEKTKNEIMFSSKWALCGSKNSRCNKEQESNGLSSSLGIRTPWSWVPLVDATLF